MTVATAPGPAVEAGAPAPAAPLTADELLLGGRATHVVTIPAGVQAGDQLVLFLTTNSYVAITGPSGWSEVRSTDGGTGFEGRLWTRTAVASDAGANVAATTTATVKSDVTVAAYRSNTGAASVAATDLTTASSVTSWRRRRWRSVRAVSWWTTSV